MGNAAMPLIYSAVFPPMIGILFSFFSPLPGWFLLTVILCFFIVVIKIAFTGIKFKQPKLSIDSSKHRKLLIFSLFFFIFTLCHQLYLTHGGSLYEPGAKYKNYVSATKEGIKFVFEGSESFYLAKRAVHRNACAFVLLAVVLSFSLTFKEKNLE
jgi:hypothetical protein